MRQRYVLSVVVTLLTVLATGVVASATPSFEGKTVRVIVGFSAGGGFDIYARVIARHVGKYLPGSPSVIVENMPGASSLIAANHLYNRVKPDGLTVGFFHGSLVLQQVLGATGILFDAKRFEWIGSPTQTTGVCAFTRKSGIASIDAWFAARTPVKLGGVAPGDMTHDTPRILAVALGLPIKLVEGYKGGSEIRLAAERDEVSGLCIPWDGLKAQWAKAIEAGDVHVVLQIAREKHRDLPTVPLATDLARTEEARQLITAGIHQPAKVLRLLALPPGTPAETVRIMRQAFLDTVKDREFIAQVTKAKLELDPLSGDELQRTVEDLFATPPNVRAKLKEILVHKK